LDRHDAGRARKPPLQPGSMIIAGPTLWAAATKLRPWIFGSAWLSIARRQASISQGSGPSSFVSMFVPWWVIDAVMGGANRPPKIRKCFRNILLRADFKAASPRTSHEPERIQDCLKRPRALISTASIAAQGTGAASWPLSSRKRTAPHRSAEQKSATRRDGPSTRVRARPAAAE
jgi:hypothetical protein